MTSYPSLSEAISGLKQRGYKEDFNLKPHCIECASLDLRWHPEQFTVDEYHRFEGMSDPDDNSIVYAISSADGVRGTLVDAYGVYAANLNDNMIRKLSVRH